MSEPEEHGRVYPCACGETFESEDELKRHANREKAREFNARAQGWITDNLGEPFESYHSDLRSDPGGVRAYETARETQIDDDRETIATEPTPENIRSACLEFARSALYAPNARILLGELDG